MRSNYFSKWFKKLFSTKGKDPLRMDITPYRDWKFIVIIFFVTLGISIAFNTYMSFQINNDSFFTTTPSKQAAALLNREGLAAVLSALARKEAAPFGTSTTTAPAIDPSR